MKVVFRIIAVLAIVASVSGCSGSSSTNNDAQGKPQARNSESKPAKTLKSQNEANSGRHSSEALKLRTMPGPFRMVEYDSWRREKPPVIAFKYNNSSQIVLGEDFLLSPKCAIPVVLNSNARIGKLTIADCVFPETAFEGIPIVWTAIDPTTVEFRLVFGTEEHFKLTEMFHIDVYAKNTVETITIESAHDVDCKSVYYSFYELRKAGDDVFFHATAKGVNTTPLNKALKMKLLYYDVPSSRSLATEYELEPITLEPFETRDFDIFAKLDYSIGHYFSEGQWELEIESNGKTLWKTVQYYTPLLPVDARLVFKKTGNQAIELEGPVESERLEIGTARPGVFPETTLWKILDGFGREIDGSKWFNYGNGTLSVFGNPPPGTYGFVFSLGLMEESVLKVTIKPSKKNISLFHVARSSLQYESAIMGANNGCVISYGTLINNPPHGIELGFFNRWGTQIKEPGLFIGLTASYALFCNNSRGDKEALLLYKKDSSSLELLHEIPFQSDSSFTWGEDYTLFEKDGIVSIFGFGKCIGWVDAKAGKYHKSSDNRGYGVIRINHGEESHEYTWWAAEGVKSKEIQFKPKPLRKDESENLDTVGSFRSGTNTIVVSDFFDGGQFSTFDQLSCIDLNGKVLWEKEFNARASHNYIAVTDRYVAYVTHKSNNIVILDAKTGKILHMENLGNSLGINVYFCTGIAIDGSDIHLSLLEDVSYSNKTIQATIRIKDLR